MTIVNEDTIDKEFDTNVYQKNLFQPTSYLNAGYGTLYEHIGTVHQNVHTHYLIVGMKIPTHKDIPVLPTNATRTCFYERKFQINWTGEAELIDNVVSSIDSLIKHYFKVLTCIQKYFKFFTKIFQLYFLIKK